MASILKRRDSYEVSIRKRGFPAVYKTFPSKREATLWAATIESEMARGLFIDRSEAERTTFRELIERYQREIAPQHRGFKDENSRLQVFLRLPIADRFVSALRSSDFATYRDDRLNGRNGLRLVKPATVKKELELFRRIIDVARREWNIHTPENPLANVKHPKVRNARTRTLNPGEREYLLAALELAERNDDGTFGASARNYWIKPLVELAIETAMRRGEMLKLTWKNVNLEKQVAHLPITKNGDPRDVPLSTAAVRILRSLPRNLDGRVFPISEDSFKKVWQRAMRRAMNTYRSDVKNKRIHHDEDFLQDLRFHDLRHEATTRLAAKVSNPLELARITGHKDLKMLLRYYNVTAEELAQKLG